MTKESIIKLIRDSKVDQLMKDMVIAYVETAYDTGFQEGMIQAAQIQKQTFAMLRGVEQ